MKTNRFRVKWREFRSIVGNEYRNVFHDGGVMLVLVFAFLIYATIYSFAYAPEVLRNIPIGVVDLDKSSASRDLERLFDAGPNTFVSYNPASMEEARELFFARKIYGIVYIPKDYQKDLMLGTSATVSLYVDASNFLMYRQVFQEIVSGVTLTGARVEVQKLLARGASIPAAVSVANPIRYESKNLFNPYLGYGSYLMPAIFLVIIQQTLLIGIGMIGGTWREFGLYRKLIVPGEKRLSVIPLVLGRTLVYFSIYAVTMLWVMGVQYRLFHFPMHGHLGAIVAFLTPFLFSCIFLGITISTWFRYREQSIMLLIWASIPMLMLSGASLPREAIPDALFTLGQIFPTGNGVDGFVRIQTMGASLEEVYPQYTRLWILTGVYFLTACFALRHLLRRIGIEPADV